MKQAGIPSSSALTLRTGFLVSGPSTSPRRTLPDAIARPPASLATMSHKVDMVPKS